MRHSRYEFPGSVEDPLRGHWVEALDVTLPFRIGELPSEYETLQAVLAASYLAPLADLQENTEKQDIAYLAKKPNCDARAIAFAALANQFSRNFQSLYGNPAN